MGSVSLHEGESEYSLPRNTTIRPAQERDLTGITQLALLQEEEFKRFDPLRHTLSETEMRQIYTNRLANSDPNMRYGIFVAEEQGKIVGYAFGRVPRERTSPYYALYQGIYIIPEARGNGISDSLTNKMVEFAAESGANALKAEAFIGSPGERYFSGRLKWRREPLSSSAFVRLVLDLPRSMVTSQ